MKRYEDLLKLIKVVKVDAALPEASNLIEEEARTITVAKSLSDVA